MLLQPQLHVKVPSTNSPTEPGMPKANHDVCSEMDMDALCGGIEAGLEESQAPEDGEESQQEMDDEGSLTQVAARKPHTQKVSSHIAVQAA
ncbi:hypothetical protein PAXRUDRAFT_20226 [Paxillus rubicundulus Ve08.2h10]|uniref:Uncharacterized protein n=1 Tax=Paxillus rubicundulus Ve08.2h10 TaxID=930991 RepID=A0A0D0D2G0_9AGAM|nr:hypothetical protein PAXRUDRAFT_20226 [Paxillus rubicundulus Ve08.2h10]